MSVVTKSRLFGAVRAILVGLGVAVATLTVNELASMPPPPPESDGFAHGMAAIFGGLIVVTSLGVSAVGVALPTLIGRDDPLGFTRWQRLALKVAVLLIGGGLLVGLAVGVVTELQYGIVLWLGLVFVATVVVCATLVWRVVQGVVRLAMRTAGGGAS